MLWEKRIKAKSLPVMASIFNIYGTMGKPNKSKVSKGKPSESATTADKKSSKPPPASNASTDEPVVAKGKKDRANKGKKK